MLALTNKGYAKITIKDKSKALKQIAKSVDLDNIKAVNRYIMDRDCSNSRKQILSQTYSDYCRFQGIKYDKPKFKRHRKDPYIPTEEDITTLIDALPLRTSVFCQILKETACRAGEAWTVKNSDIDHERRLVRIKPEKNSNPRTLKISNNLLDRINKMHTSEVFVFLYKSNSKKKITRLIERQRNRITRKMQKPKLKLIHFHTFRHWKATMEYRKTRDIIHVQNLLGHKNINNIMKSISYTETLEQYNDEWNCRTAESLNEATKLIESGFEYVTEMNGVKLFRKRK